MIPNVSPKLFSLSAVIVGYILIDDMTANEQNALGNWLMLVAQVLSTNAFYRQVVQERGLEAKNSKESEKKGSHKSKNKNEIEETINMLEKMIKALKEEIETMKNSQNIF